MQHTQQMFTLYTHTVHMPQTVHIVQNCYKPTWPTYENSQVPLSLSQRLRRENTKRTRRKKIEGGWGWGYDYFNFKWNWEYSFHDHLKFVYLTVYVNDVNVSIFLNNIIKCTRLIYQFEILTMIKYFKWNRENLCWETPSPKNCWTNRMT